MAEPAKTAAYRLRSCVWELTLACCFRCAYCGSGGGVARKDELNTAEALDVAGQLAELGCRRVSLIGGEIFLRPDWAEIAGALTGRGVRVCVITNGYTMTPPLLARLRETGVESVAVSLDGPREAHDRFRRQGSFDGAMAALSALTNAGIPASVITTLRADNAPLLPALYELLKPLPIFAWQLQACSPMGNACKNGLDVRFDAAAVIGFVRRTVEAGPPFYVGIADNIGYYTPGEGMLRGTPGAVFTGCAAGLTSVGIDSVGNVRGCESLYDPAFNEGNLRENTLAEIWGSPTAFLYNRAFTPALLTGKCAGCEMGAVCAGGCRSYNRFSTGKLYESPICAKTQTRRSRAQERSALSDESVRF